MLNGFKGGKNKNKKTEKMFYSTTMKYWEKIHWTCYDFLLDR